LDYGVPFSAMLLFLAWAFIFYGTFLQAIKEICSGKYLILILGQHKLLIS
jgi:hypothetical protein